MRATAIAERRSAGENPFPHKFDVSISLTAFLAQYAHVPADQVLTDVTVSIAGGIAPGNVSDVRDFRTHLLETRVWRQVVVL